MKSSLPTTLAFVLLFAGPSAADPFRVTIRGTVDFNSIGAPPLGAATVGQPASLSFRVDSSDFLNSPSFPTRGYFIVPSSWELEIDGVSIGLEDPYSGFGAMFVIRDNDPAVDGFLVSDNVDFPVGVPLDEPGVLGAFEHSFLVTYGETLLPSLDIADAVGSYGFDGLTVFNWTIDDGPFSPLGLLFGELSIEPIPPLLANAASISLSAGGQQTLTLEAGANRAGWVHWMFGSATGTSPGLPFGAGVVLPLNFDAYFKLTLTKPFLGLFGSFLGVLDAQGSATSTLTLPPGTDPDLAGVTLHHAYLAAPGIGGSDYASNAVPVLLAP